MDTIKAHCNQCQGDTNHDILHVEKTSWSEEIEENCSIHGCDIFEMLRCRGCDSIRLRHKSYFSEADEETTVYYPPAMARREPDWFFELGDPFNFGENVIQELLKEIYTALHNGSLRLAAMGSRAILERTMIEKVGDHESFVKNVQAFGAKGFLSEQQVKFLTETLDAGHASMHRAWKPSLSDLATLLDATESIIQSVYVLDKKVAKLKGKIPLRVKAKAIDELAED